MERYFRLRGFPWYDVFHDVFIRKRAPDVFNDSVRGIIPCDFVELSENSDKGQDGEEYDSSSFDDDDSSEEGGASDLGKSDGTGM